MKILFVDLERDWRGGQCQALLALRGFRAAGHEAELVAAEDGALAQRAQGEKIPVHAVPRGARRLGAARAVRRLLGEGFDIVHANEPHALTAAWLAGAHRRAALVTSRRIALPLRRGAVARMRYRAARRIIAISEFVAGSVRASGIPARQLDVVYDGVEILPLPTVTERNEARHAWGVKEGETLLGCVGYLLPEKGQQYLVSALAALQEEFAGVKLLLAGQGPLWDDLGRQADVMCEQNSVIFAGHLENVAMAYAATDIFVFPSLAEPLGTSLLAAMAYGLPVVARESGGVPEIIRSGTDGLLVYEPKSENMPQALASAVGHILREPGLGKALGAAARKTIEERFSAERMVAETLFVYETVI